MKKTAKWMATLLAVAVILGGGTVLDRSNHTMAAPSGHNDCVAGDKGKAIQPPSKNDGQSNQGQGQPRPPKQSGPANGGQATSPANAPSSSSLTTVTTSEDGTVSVTVSGGYETDPQDHGRPVVLIAAALGVPTEVFREAFSGVTPAELSSGGPTALEAQSNKAALLKVLAPYGITNDRLDEVSNYYRYNGQQSQTWKIVPAVATAIVKNGVVTGIAITNPGSGYSSAPTITIKSPNGTTTAKATVSYSKDFALNGSISSITLK
ncbi:hypothetical protein [Cohnella zeiphila]|uniref:Uncharacterized protein n=1 Tax=Cohnella zeiphila TaxID=2761120 RepID=A0A7X0SRA3_9BACL|nr:hypothetical protein [Cohnella zeiphila]MBB6734698.1 hypothetical protein [Cohnella zeiphila]